jgi:hypothetical protein
MKKGSASKRILAFVVACLAMINAHAFEVRTHGALTREAWARFLAENPGVFDRLGIRDTDDPFKTKSYYDYRPADGATPISRSSIDWYEDTIMRNVLGVPAAFSVRGWLIRGAIREDDDLDADDESPKEDPYGDFHRVFSHFHDPVNNRGLTVTVLGQTVQLGARAADWALDPTAFTPAFPPFSIPGVTPAPQRSNHFGLASFRESLWRAVTGLNQAGAAVATTASERNLYWATAFRALGDILHLNQDMAVPQHTRNDAHAGATPTTLTGHKSVFERYIDARVRELRGFSTRDDNDSPANVAINLQEITFGNYPIPRFTRYADYWTTPGKKGLADYSNRGFFSIGTLPGNTNYTSPSTNTDADYTQQSVPITRWDGSPYPVTFNSTLYVSKVPVPDDQEPTLAGPVQPLFAWSLWDEAAQGILAPFAGTTLVKRNYDAAIDLLIPRAVAYSAGILQYAFRGKLEISLPDEGVYGVVDHNDAAGNTKDTGGFPKIKMKLRNVTTAVNGVEPMGAGTLRAVARFHRNTCYKADLSGEYGSPGIDWRNWNPDPEIGCGRNPNEEIVVSEPVAAIPADLNGAAQSVTFNFPTRIPINATDLYLQVVYRGPLGQPGEEETDAVVVATKDISEPNYAYNYSRWDQNRYANYPSLESGTNTWAEWCAQGYASLEACNSSMGLTNKYRNSPTASPIPGYDPTTAAVPPDTWTDLSQEPPFTPFGTLTAPVGKLARIAVLVDANPTNRGLLVQEWINTSLTNPTSNFRWFSSPTITAAIIQRDPATDTLTPTVTYLPGRGVYLPAEENLLLTGGNEPNIPSLILAPSQINF